MEFSLKRISDPEELHQYWRDFLTNPKQVVSPENFYQLLYEKVRSQAISKDLAWWKKEFYTIHNNIPFLVDVIWKEDNLPHFGTLPSSLVVDHPDFGVIDFRRDPQSKLIETFTIDEANSGFDPDRSEIDVWVPFKLPQDRLINLADTLLRSN